MRRDKLLQIRLTDEENKLFQSHAKSLGWGTLSDWVRVTLKQSVSVALKEPNYDNRKN